MAFTSIPDGMFAISQALCRLAGIDPKHVTELHYSHKVGELPTIRAKMYVTSQNGQLLIEDGDVVRATKTYEWREVT